MADEWKERGANLHKDYAILTNEIYKSGFGFSAKEYKNIKGLHESQNLRDSMTNIELTLTNLGEVAAVEIHKNNNSNGLYQLKNDINKAGNVLKKSKEEFEKEYNDNQEFSFNNKISNLVIDNIKDHELYNYSKFGDLIIKIYVNEKTSKLVK